MKGSNEQHDATTPDNMSGTEVQLIEREGRYGFRFGSYYFEVDPNVGGRVTEFSLEERNILVGPMVHPSNYGSTFWTSPQSDWNWPPPAEIDSARYATSMKDDEIVLSGPVSAQLNVSASKRFRVDRSKRAVDLELTIHNHGGEIVSMAPWQVSRVGPNGLTFFPTGQAVTQHHLPVAQNNGITWYAHDATAITAANGQKYVADGAEGWLAHLSSGLLFLMTFVDVPADRQAPGEGEIEIYANRPGFPGQAYVELESQGAYEPIPPGGQLSWTVRWQLRNLPANIQANAPSDELVGFARSLTG